jgi:hypothetical protein
LIPLVAQPCCLVRMGHICWWIPPAVGSNSLVRPQEFCVPWPQEQAREQVAKYAQEADCHYCDLRPLVLGDAGMQKLNGGPGMMVRFTYMGVWKCDIPPVYGSTRIERLLMAAVWEITV